MLAMLSLLYNKLDNKSFIEKAPQEVVEKEKQKQDTLKEKVKKIKENINNLS
jgi:valyl-tRNA synthetase